MPASSFVAWAGNSVIGVTRVIRVTEPDRTNLSATSRAAFPATPDSAPGIAGVALGDSRAGAVTPATRAATDGVPQIDHTNQSGNPCNPGHPGDCSGARPLAVQPDEERAALIEHEGGIPREITKPRALAFEGRIIRVIAGWPRFVQGSITNAGDGSPASAWTSTGPLSRYRVPPP